MLTKQRAHERRGVAVGKEQANRVASPKLELLVIYTDCPWADATTHAELLFPNGMTAKLHTSMTAWRSRVILLLKGEMGSLELTNFVAPQNGGRLTVEIGGKTRVEPVDGPTTYAAQLAHVGDVLLRGAAPLTGGADAVANMACIEAIYAAAGFTRG